MPKELNNMEKAFVKAYIENSFNGTRAYLSLKPETKPESAGVMATRMLRKVKVKEEIDRILERGEPNNQFTREKILGRFEHLGSLAEKEKQYTASIHANREVAKISGLYDQNSDDSGYIALIQKITNIQINTEPSAKQGDIIDLPGEDN